MKVQVIVVINILIDAPLVGVSILTAPLVGVRVTDARFADVRASSIRVHARRLVPGHIQRVAGGVEQLVQRLVTNERLAFSLCPVTPMNRPFRVTITPEARVQHSEEICDVKSVVDPDNPVLRAIATALVDREHQAGGFPRDGLVAIEDGFALALGKLAAVTAARAMRIIAQFDDVVIVAGGVCAHKTQGRHKSRGWCANCSLLWV